MNQTIEIWAPKYSTNEVLIATHRIKAGDNFIVFTKADHLKGKTFKIHSDIIKQSKVQPNGRGKVYCVPFESLIEV